MQRQIDEKNKKADATNGNGEKRNGFSRIDPYAPEQHLFMDLLKRYLVEEQKFGIVDGEKVRALQKDKGTVIYDNETIFNRALGEDKKQSNFFVFMRRIKDERGSSKVEVYFSDPEVKNEQNTINEKKEDYLIREVFVMGDENDAARRVAERIAKCAEKKPKNEYRKISHGHWGKIGDRWIADDGVSRFEDVIRTMMLYHIDYDATSPHNSFEEEVFDFLSNLEKLIGIEKIPATELTAAFPPDGPNGPHLLLWMADKETAAGIKNEILERRKNLKMISYFSGMTIWEMLPVIGKYRDDKKLALGIAHPANFTSKILPIYNIGLLSAIKKGKLDISTVEQIVAMSDSVGAWNPCMNENIPLDPTFFKGYVAPMIHRNLGIKRMTTNAINLAFSFEMRNKYNVYTHFDPDDHTTMPMNYDCGGDKYGMGFTQIIVPPRIYEGLKAKPNSRELIEMIRKREIVMKSVQYITKTNDEVRIANSRKDIPIGKVELFERLKKASMRRYINALTNDFWNMLWHGEFHEIGDMKG